ncbi:MAG: topoisomerase DNA-binding C4 zinc finger domain-containing protein, partial [Candidatus Omnitrophica bacterium]|nr:topoisomerase DNA-binding C4 zinc finger domain-containing protein [Candidatus Omnitrophota bacterium]
RNYTKREKRSFIPTDLGIKVCDLLVKSFSRVMDENFTALMEQSLDKVESGAVEWHQMLSKFYPDFKKKVDEVLASATKEVEFSDKFCPQCKGRLVIKWSRRGRFLSCEHFPKCRYGESITSGVKCPQCKKGELVERRNRRGQNFYGCSTFPECRYTSRTLPDEDDSRDENNVDQN